jgi:L-rhamnose isomerase/sugar isomerase
MQDRDVVLEALRGHRIELPSWAFGNSGTRFKVFAQPGVPRNPFEKADDAAQVHKYTGVAPSMAVHIPWDKVDDYEALAVHAKRNGISIGTVNANVFQTTTTSSARSATRTPSPLEGRRPPARVHRRHGRDRLG